MVHNLLADIRRSPRKQEKRPVYVLNLTIPSRELDNCLEPSKMTVFVQVSLS
jgi:DNA mismatch repair protein MLH3